MKSITVEPRVLNVLVNRAFELKKEALAIRDRIQQHANRMAEIKQILNHGSKPKNETFFYLEEIYEMSESFARDEKRFKEIMKEIDSITAIVSLLAEFPDEYQDSMDTSTENEPSDHSGSVRKPAILRILDVISMVLLVVCLFQFLFS